MTATSIGYAQACHPDRWTILGRELLPYSIGHAVLLAGQNSPFASESFDTPAKHADLLLAVWTCSHTYERASVERMSIAWRWWALRCKLRFALDPVVFETRALLFAEYVAAHVGNVPTIWKLEGAGRPTSAPTCLMLKAALMQGYGYQESRVMNMPFGQAVWEHIALLDKQGVASFTTDLHESLMALAAKLASEAAHAQRS